MFHMYNLICRICQKLVAINLYTMQSGTDTKDGEVAVEAPETKPKSEVLSEKSVDQMGDPSTSSASLPAKGASASQVADNTTKRLGEEGKAERYPNIVRISDDDRERASRVCSQLKQINLHFSLRNSLLQDRNTSLSIYRKKMTRSPNR